MNGPLPTTRELASHENRIESDRSRSPCWLREAGGREMKAAVYHGPYDIRIEEMPTPSSRPASSCSRSMPPESAAPTSASTHGPVSYATNGHDVTGHHGPLIPGHEFSGRVVEVAPDVEGFELGMVVASGAGISCGECRQCLAGRTNLCVRYSTVGLQRHGALAEYCAVPASTCIAVESLGLDEETAALAQPMSIGVHSFRRGRARPGEDVVVVGAGGIGAFLTYAAAASGASVTVVDLEPERLELASALGAANTVQASAEQTLADVVAEHRLVPAAVYEVTGNETVFRQAFDAVPPGGRLVVVGLQDEPRLVDLRSVTLREIELIGTNAHVVGDDLPEALRLLASRDSDWSDVAPTVIPLGAGVRRAPADGRGSQREDQDARRPLGRRFETAGGTVSGDLRVGFAGLGRMGRPMAANLAAAGVLAGVYNRTAGRADDFAAEYGVEPFPTPAALAGAVDVFVTMLADDAASAAIYLGEGGFLEATRPASVALEMSTVSVPHVTELAGRLAVGGSRLSTSPSQEHRDGVRRDVDAHGRGDPETLERVRPALDALGARVFHVGPVGTGAVMKLAVNAVVYGLNGALSEGLVLAERAGNRARAGVRGVRRERDRCAIQHYRRALFERPGEGPVGITMTLAASDLELILELAEVAAYAMPQAELNLDVLRRAIADGFAEDDVTAVAQMLRRASDVTADVPAGDG